MSKNPFYRTKKACDVSEVMTDAQFMLEQLCLPLGTRDSIKAKRERAIRRSPLTPSKSYRLWYWKPQETWELLGSELIALADRYVDHVRKLERTNLLDKQTLATLRRAREMRERQREMDFNSHSSALDSYDATCGDPT